MRSYFLIILWIIIIGGGAYVYLNAQKNAPTNEVNVASMGSEEALTPSEKNLNTAELNKAGDSLFNQESYDSAINYYIASLKINPSDNEVLNRLGESYLMKNEGEKAIQVFNAVLKRETTNTNANIGLARVMILQKNFEKARDILWGLNVNDYKLNYYKGIVYILFKDFENAQKVFKALVDDSSTPEKIKSASQKIINAYTTFNYFTESEDIFLQTLIAKALVQSKEYGSAIPLLFDIVSQKSNYRDAWIILGYCYLKLNLSNDAISALEKAITLDESNSTALFYLGLAYELRGDNKGAIGVLEKARSLGYEPAEELSLKIADLYVKVENYKLAANELSKILNKEISNLSALTTMAYISIEKLNSPEVAVNYTEKALEKNGEDSAFLNLAGWAKVANGEYGDAKDLLEKAIKISPELDAAYLNLGWLYEKINNTQEALRMYNKAVELSTKASITQKAQERIENLIKKNDDTDNNN